MSYIGKTPASAALTSSDITDGIITLPKLTDGTDGNIISYDASGKPVAVATGTDGQVLTSTGAGSPPAFETASGGDFVLISSTALSTASSYTTDSIDSTYKMYKIMVNITAIGTQYAKLYLRLRASGSDITAANYDWTGGGTFRYTDDSDNGTWIDGKISDTFYPFHGVGGLDTDAGEGVSSEIVLYNPSETVGYKTMRSHANFLYDSSRWYQVSTALQYGTTAAYTGVTIYTSAGTMSGTINLYGIK
jgi:hypothetical protein